MTRTTPESDDSSESEVSDNETNQNSQQQEKDFIEKLRWLIHIFFQAMRKPRYSIELIIKYLMVDCGGYDKFDKLAKWLARNPLSSFALLIIALISVPFLLIFGFLASIAVITLTGFIALEGTLLTFISIIFFGCLGALIIVLILIFATVYAMYIGFANIYDMYGSGNVNALFNWLKTEHNAYNNSKDRYKTVATNKPNVSIDSVGPTSQ